MNTRDAVALIRGAVPRHVGIWADLGAGDGTFTKALARLLGPGSRIYAVDRDARTIAALERWAATAPSDVIPVTADFTEPLVLPGLQGPGLDGMLLANALHFVRRADVVLQRLVETVRPGGRVVIVEYDARTATPWVPYPIPVSRIPALTASAGLSQPVVAATRPSAFGGTIYAAAANRPPGP